MKIKSTTCLIILLLVLIRQLAAQTNERIRISQDLELVRITANAYMHVSYAVLPGYGRSSANGLIFINEKKAFLFDTPWNDSLTSKLVYYLENTMKLKIEGFIPNHWHEDCMGGLIYIKSRGIKSYANQLTTDIAKKKNLPSADQGFRDSIKISLGNKVVMCYYFGPAHSIDNVVVWIPSEKILFPGCMCKSMDSGNLGNTADGDVSEYRATIDKVINRFCDAKIVVPGHGTPGGKELLLHTKELIP
ncbi:MAG TPA: subclass B1 metallo-beta-lactamase [Bacteroidales bacterium]|jgi:metallo-beta-lactamase class B|nr:subclass B1 metallo-beta-lactamase [Bacteroidales bacterium]